jgi:Class II flagellar assembly regulator
VAAVTLWKCSHLPRRRDLDDRAGEPPLPLLGRICRPLYRALTMRAESLPVRIDPKHPASPAGASALQRRPAAGRGFSLSGEPAAAKASGATASTPLATLDALLALQGEGDPAERRRRTVKRGQDLLDGLDRLKAALLGSRVPTADLLRLAAQLAEHADLSGDPRLDELVSHIELRAKVELAKLGVS